MDTKTIKKREWINGNRMKIETGCKTFDRQCDCISTGNVFGRVQFSSYIRGKKITECNGRENQQGHLQEYDLSHFTSCPNSVKDDVRAFLNGKDCGILYEFRHYNGEQKIIHGWLLTDDDHNLIRKYNYGHGNKSCKVLSEVAKYISNEVVNGN